MTREDCTQAQTAPAPLAQAKMNYEQALQAVADEQAAQPRTKDAQQHHLARLTFVRQVLAPAELAWRALDLEARTALQVLLTATAQAGRPRAGDAKRRAEEAEATLMQLCGPLRADQTLLEAVQAALVQPVVDGRPLVGGLIG